LLLNSLKAWQNLSEECKKKYTYYKVKSKINSENACHHSVQNPLSSIVTTAFRAFLAELIVAQLVENYSPFTETNIHYLVHRSLPPSSILSHF
jgi:hypothetical protein